MSSSKAACVLSILMQALPIGSFTVISIVRLFDKNRPFIRVVEVIHALFSEQPVGNDIGEMLLFGA